MKKDIIYIDTEDDITAIIGRIKSASASIVALVPPKRTGALQSIVNLKLLQKSALASNKRVVLITADRSLTSLAAGVKLPVARNLQSRPEIPQMPTAPSEADEVIDGEALPVGEIAEVANENHEDSTTDQIVQQIDLADKDLNKTPSINAVSKAAGKIKIPNFNRFRKRLFIIAGVAIVVLSFLFWAIVIAPTAKITISARTSAVNIDHVLSVQPNLNASVPGEFKLKPTVVQIKKSTEADFTATGTKNVGNKATGSLTLSNSVSSDPVLIPAGTQFTAQSLVFTSDADVTVPGATVNHGIVPGSAKVNITASDIGGQYNIGAQSYSTNAPVSASAPQATGGGSSQTVTVVSQADVDKAKTQLPPQDPVAVKAELHKQFGANQVIIDLSYTATSGDPSASPNVGEQGSQGKLTVETTYTMIGVATNDIKQILASDLKAAIGSHTDQGVVDDGLGGVRFQSFQQLDDSSYSSRLVSTGYIGPKIDTKQLTAQIAGKQYGDASSIISQLPYVNKVDIQLSPFWVASIPSDLNKISIKISVVSSASAN